MDEKEAVELPRTIVDLLKLDDAYASVRCGNRRMYYQNDLYQIVDQPPHKRPRLIFATDDESAAVAVLLQGVQ